MVHGALCRGLCRCAAEAGLEAESEEVCPELVQGKLGSEDCIEARLDVHLWGQGDGVLEEWIDVTATHPQERDKQQAAAQQSGAAVQSAEGRKRKRYGVGIGGVQCTPAGFESWGLMGVDANAVLDRMAAQHSARTGQPRHVTLRRWRAELGIALNRALAATVAQAARVPRAEQEADPHALVQGGVRDELDLEL